MICGFKNCYNKNFRKSGAFLSIFPFQQPLPSPVWPAVQLWFPPISAQHRIGCIFFRRIFSSSYYEQKHVRALRSNRNARTMDFISRAASGEQPENPVPEAVFLRGRGLCLRLRGVCGGRRLGAHDKFDAHRRVLRTSRARIRLRAVLHGPQRLAKLGIRVRQRDQPSGV